MGLSWSLDSQIARVLFIKSWTMDTAYLSSYVFSWPASRLEFADYSILSAPEVCQCRHDSLWIDVPLSLDSVPKIFLKLRGFATLSLPIIGRFRTRIYDKREPVV